MDERQIREILQTVIDGLSGRQCVWRLEGSANLKIQGVDVPVWDLDITTDDEGIAIF